MSNGQDYPDLFIPRDYLTRAHDFYCACKVLPDFHPAFMSMWPQHALFGHAIELVLKAYLLSKGIDRETLRKEYGHRLVKLLRQSVVLGLPNDERVAKMIEFINEPLSTQMPRYPNPETMGNAVATIPQFYADYDRLVQTVCENI
ncbi:hypothetical protein [Rhizobium sp. BR 315]|uniref:hypothetical protein n=1 Tax=Rhizobium sp. BR 315 TaxID=3040014 RepID=UPI003D34A672